MNAIRYRLAVLSAALVFGAAMIGLAGCDAANSEANGRVQLHLTDAPIDEMDSVIVIVDRIVLVGDTNETGGIVLLDDDVALDLLDFQNGVDTMLVNELVPGGDYRQIRFYLTDSTYVYLKDGSEQHIKVPSGFVRINLPEFEIDEDDDIVVITIDFDVNQSFVEAGNSGMYLFKPVIHPTEFIINGEDIDLPPAEE